MAERDATSLPIRDLIERVSGPEFTLLRPRSASDPYPAYRALAARSDLYRSPLGYWLIPGYRECVDLLRDPGLGALSDFASRPDVVRGHCPVLERLHRSWFLFADPPRHGRVRRAVAECTARGLRTAMDEVVGPLAADMVASIDWSRPVDVVAELARPYPMGVIGSVLGLPPDDLPHLRSLTVVMSESMEPFLGSARLRRAEEAARRLVEYVESQDRTTNDPRESALGELLSGSRLDPATGLAHLVLLLTAGQETTVNLIGMSVLALLSQRPDTSMLPESPTRLSRAVDELLRYTSPIQLVVRRVLEPRRVLGSDLEPGHLVWLLLAAANRDPHAFADPDRLDLSRQPNEHLAFATGTHICFGAALTRAEMRAVLQHLVPVLDSIEVDDSSVIWQRKRTGRGLDRLVVRPR